MEEFFIIGFIFAMVGVIFTDILFSIFKEDN